MQVADIKERFKLPRGCKDAEELSSMFYKLALCIISESIDSREETISIERLEESYMWALKSTRLKSNPEEEH